MVIEDQSNLLEIIQNNLEYQFHGANHFIKYGVSVTQTIQNINFLLTFRI